MTTIISGFNSTRAKFFFFFCFMCSNLQYGEHQISLKKTLIFIYQIFDLNGLEENFSLIRNFVRIEEEKIYITRTTIFEFRMDCVRFGWERWHLNKYNRICSFLPFWHLKNNKIKTKNGNKYLDGARKWYK